MTNKTMGKLLTIALLLICSVSMATVHEVQIVGTTFSPQNIQIEAGDTVRWINNGGFHNIRSNDGSFRCSDTCEIMPNDGNGSPSSTWDIIEVTFNTIGLYDYICEIHVGAGMIGSVEVVFPTTKNVHQIMTDGFTFMPDDLTISSGDVVNFINVSGFHNVRADDDSFECSVGCLGVGTNLTSEPSSALWDVFVSFDDLGTIPYYCEQHGDIGGVGMSGIVRVNSSVIFMNGFENE